ncbi:hypothetical protein GCM10017783_17470 [Deinococcus piscis]|uniref:O-antigen ligase-related domain-containing protein n=1 Tax=Deinococcus piscis TaxID=394230 RepID=A0ABQ3K7H9_9DEIO|nr:hypothetical protein GCM10017783_17470 [Deinococcus piscis]
MLPPVLGLGLLGLAGWPGLRRLPAAALWVLGFYALSQMVPALLAPDPGLALAGATVRTGLMGGLIGLGAWLGSGRGLAPLGLGLLAVYATALYGAVSHPQDIYITRLTHPYMTSTTLGLAGTLGVWLALFSSHEPGTDPAGEQPSAPAFPWLAWLSAPAWRLLLGLSGALIILASGSRGALLAAIIGAAAGSVQQRSRLGAAAIALLGALGAAGVWLGERLGISALARFSDTSSSGRDLVWGTTAEVIQTYPLGGVGSYGLGRFLQLPQPCQLWPDASGVAPPCPDWMSDLTARIGSPWLIAHNGFLQQLAETGPLGTAGLMTLLGLVIYAAWHSREALLIAVVAGLLVATVNDNLLLVPSPFFAEVFWLAAGAALYRLGREPAAFASPAPLRVGLLGAGAAALLAFPVWATPQMTQAAAPPEAPRLMFLDAPATIAPDSSSKTYAVTAQFQGPDGSYRAVLSSCQDTCVPVSSAVVRIKAGQSDFVDLPARLRPDARQTLSLRLYAAAGRSNAPLLGEHRWEVSQ